MAILATIKIRILNTGEPSILSTKAKRRRKYPSKMAEE